MNSCKHQNIHERTTIIPISQNSPTNKKDGFSVNEYSLKQSIFDPSKSSPPNEFMLKLRLRMNHYETFSKVDNLIKE
jgi:hypothetical protein